MADAQIAVESGPPLKGLVALIRCRSDLEDIPQTAVIDEITRCKRLLREQNALEALVRTESGLFDTLHEWWEENQVTARIATARKLQDKAGDLLGALDLNKIADKTTQKSRLVELKQAFYVAHAEIARIEGDLAVLTEDEQTLLQVIQPEGAAFLLDFGPARRAALIAQIDGLIEAVERAAKKDAESWEMAKGCFFLVIFLICIGAACWVIFSG